MISTGRLADHLVAKARTTGDDRWRSSPSCLAACWRWYTTVSTVSSSSVLWPCSPTLRTSSTSSATSTRSRPSVKKSCVNGLTIYHRWVEAFAHKRQIPLEWAEKGVRTEDYVRPHLRRLERRHPLGVYFILKSMELGPSFRSAVPRFPVDDPHYLILARQRSRYTPLFPLFLVAGLLLGQTYRSQDAPKSAGAEDSSVSGRRTISADFYGTPANFPWG